MTKNGDSHERVVKVKRAELSHVIENKQGRFEVIITFESKVDAEEFSNRLISGPLLDCPGEWADPD